MFSAASAPVERRVDFSAPIFDFRNQQPTSVTHQSMGALPPEKSTGWGLSVKINRVSG